MNTQMVQNGNLTTGKNVSATYAESENQNTITIYKKIYTYIGLNNYYSTNTTAANILLSITLVIILFLLCWIVYLAFRTNGVVTIGGYNMTGGANSYYNVIRTPKIVHDLFD
jgi:hypothetical protein